MDNRHSGYKHKLAHVGLLYTAAIWGATFFVVKDALAEVNPLALVGYRFSIAGLVLLIWLLLKKKPVLKDLKRGLVLALILAPVFLSQTIGLQYTTASNSGFITGLFVAFVPLFQRTLFKTKPSLMEVAASGVSLVGLWILTGGLVDMNIGDGLTLITAATAALHLLVCDRFMKTGSDPIILSCQQFLLVGLLSFVSALLTDSPMSFGTPEVGLVLLFLALFPTLSAFVIQLLSQTIVSPMRVSLIFALEPAFGALFAWTLGGEVIVVHRALGGLLIFAALLLSGLRWPIRRNG